MQHHKIGAFAGRDRAPVVMAQQPRRPAGDQLPGFFQRQDAVIDKAEHRQLERRVVVIRGQRRHRAPPRSALPQRRCPCASRRASRWARPRMTAPSLRARRLRRLGGFGKLGQHHPQRTPRRRAARRCCHHGCQSARPCGSSARSDRPGPRAPRRAVAVQLLQQGQMRLGAAAAFQRLPGQARRAFAPGQRRVWQVIVEHHIGNRACRAIRASARLELVQQVGLEAQLHLHRRCAG